MACHIRKAHPEIYRNALVNDVSTEIASINSSSAINPPANMEPTKIRQLNTELKQNGEKLAKLSNERNDLELDAATNDLLKILRNALVAFPRPVHPATKFFRMGKQDGFTRQKNTTFNQNSNPERQSKRNREQKKAKYNHAVMQHLFYHRRKKCVQQLMNTANEKNCTIPIPDLTASFQNQWQVVNDNIMLFYSSPSASEQQIADQNFTDEISIEDVACSLKTMKKKTLLLVQIVFCVRY